MIDNRPGLMLPPYCLPPPGVPGRAAGKGLELRPPLLCREAVLGLGGARGGADLGLKPRL